MKILREEDVGLDLIEVGDRLREVDQAAAQSLAASMNERGLMTRIELREIPGDKFRLNTGAHRYVAAQILAWSTIPALIIECSDDEARLREIDENLYRSELSPYDQANFLEERRQIWTRVNGEFKRGGDRRSKAQFAPLIGEVRRGKDFFVETAEKFSLSPHALKRAFTRRAQISPKVWEQLRGTDAAKNGALLDKLRKLTVEDQIHALEIKRQRGCDMKVAVNLAAPKPEGDRAERELQKLRSAWKFASSGVRQAFLIEIGANK